MWQVKAMATHILEIASEPSWGEGTSCRLGRRVLGARPSSAQAAHAPLHGGRHLTPGVLFDTRAQGSSTGSEALIQVRLQPLSSLVVARELQGS